ncbi:hypothetical protein BJ508DRAFT_363854 [Ascobolus immersus RN42]|uniref:C2H2-type domain-containing protein n=1 Tax=Ascobolus immersus RN42 TaxID=1160509 RepID=A0A3N4I194_ASCIM|nr:hypothetical protein BJ508DRAFT_363854 [Ascobolus immersus RN42]
MENTYGATTWDRRSLHQYQSETRPDNTSTPPPLLKREHSLDMSEYSVSPAQSPVAGMAIYDHHGQPRQMLVRSTSEPSLYNEYQGQQTQQHQDHQLPPYTYDRQQQSPTTTASPNQTYSHVHSVVHSPVDTGSPSSAYSMENNGAIYYNVSQGSGMDTYPRSYLSPPLARKHSAPSLPPIQQSMTVSTTFSFPTHVAMQQQYPVSPPPSPPDHSTYTGSQYDRVPLTTYYHQTNRVKKQRKPKQREQFAVFSSDHKIFKCTFENCTSRFSRQEHLRRHENTHYPERKPYVCPVERCWRPFSRTDNLKQHLHSHKKPGGKNRYVPDLVVE